MSKNQKGVNNHADRRNEGYIPRGGGLFDPGSHGAGAAENRRLGRAETAVAAESEAAGLLRYADDRNAERASGGGRPAGRRTARPADKAAGQARGRHRGAESGRSNGMGAEDEQHPQQGRGDRPRRADLGERVLNMFFRPKRKYAVLLSPAERKLIRYCLMELRNKLAAEGFDTEDVDGLTLRIT